LKVSNAVLAGLVPAIHASPLRKGRISSLDASSSSCFETSPRGCPRQARAWRRIYAVRGGHVLVEVRFQRIEDEKPPSASSLSSDLTGAVEIDKDRQPRVKTHW